MTTPTNWANPEQPGVPLFPERDGAHAFEHDNDRDLLVVYHWDSKESCWLEFPKGSSKEWDKGPDLDGLKYHGPVLTPTQIAEMLVGERERIKKMVGRACDLGSLITPRQRDMIVAGIDSEAAIRNLGAAP